MKKGKRCVLALTPEERIMVHFSLEWAIMEKEKRNLSPRSLKAATRVVQRIVDWLKIGNGEFRY